MLRPSWSIHTWFMRFPLDVVFVDSDQVVIKIAAAVKPFRTASCRGAREVVELRAGECARRGLAVGDRIAWAPRAELEPADGVPPDLQRDEPRGRVLVASRDARYVKLSRFLLEGRGIEVSSVVAPGELVDEAAEADADVVILDAQDEVTKACRLRTPRGAGVPSFRFSSSARARPSEVPPGSASTTSGTRPRTCSPRSSGTSQSSQRRRQGFAPSVGNEDGRDNGNEQAAVTTIEDSFPGGNDEHAGVRSPEGGLTPNANPAPPSTRPAIGVDQLARLHEGLAAGLPAVARPLLDSALSRAERLNAAAGYGEDGLRIAASSFAAEAVVVLAVEGVLEASDAQAAVDGLAATCGIRTEAARLELYRRAITAPQLIDLPPLLGAGIHLRLILDLRLAEEVSLWRRSPAGSVDCLIHFGSEAPSRRMRAEAKAALRPRAVRLVSRSTLRAVRIRRLGRPYAVIVARLAGQRQRNADVYLEAAAASLAGVLEREHLLERSAIREQALVAASERRLMRLGFDLHDGPVQDILALASEVTQLRDQAYPFVLDSHRELVAGRFDDALLRLVDIDRQLREIAHSLESRSVVSRPLGEILHRETEAFQERTGIEVHLELRGDAEDLSSGQRVAVFRAIQEALANVREHSGASRVDLTVRARRNSIEVRIVDDGTGFEVERALARAAQRGRLGLVGIGERVRMLGGTFDVDSAPGGPTALTFSLPRWEPLIPRANPD